MVASAFGAKATAALAAAALEAGPALAEDGTAAEAGPPAAIDEDENEDAAVTSPATPSGRAVGDSC